MSATITTSQPLYNSTSATINTTLPLGVTVANAVSNNYPYTITSAGSSSSGQYLQSNGINSTWTSPTWTVGDYANSSLQVRGDANFEGDVKIKGKSIVDLINNIEQRLAILHPNTELENKWEDLKKLGDMYRQLEQEIIEKEKMWAILKE
jgi:hypothetical protein